jgi:hypothetical protein
VFDSLIIDNFDGNVFVHEEAEIETILNIEYVCLSVTDLNEK